jgi:hypothetical protein
MDSADCRKVGPERATGVQVGCTLRRRSDGCAATPTALSRQRATGRFMDEDAFNMSVRRFLKKLGVSAQREIELAVREQLEAGELRGDERLEATATITVRGLSRDVLVTGTIALS